MNKNSHRLKILIVEDELAIRQGLVDVFVFHGYEVEEASDGEVGLQKALTGQYHLILLDIMLPKKDGLTVCQEIRKKDRTQPILMLTAKGDEEDIIHGLKLGADDYVTKPFSIRELLARAEAVLRRSGKLRMEQKLVEWAGLIIDPENLIVKRNKEEIELTRKEVDLLLYFIEHADRPVSRKELLKEVWGYGHTDMDTRTVDIHITKLRRKIEIDPENPVWIETVRGEGYRMGSRKGDVS